MEEILNPYIAGAPVTEVRMFFGRKDIFDWIQENLTGLYIDHILVIHGQRRVGKTSVLKQLKHHLPEGYITAFLDLQGRTHASLDRFLWWLAREIVRILKQDYDLDLEVPGQHKFAESADYFENEFIPMVIQKLGTRTLLLTFDEFDTLEEAGIKENLSKPFIDLLKPIIGRQGITFIFSIGSSGRKLENMQASYTEFFKTALYKKVSFLGKEDTYKLISEPVKDSLGYDPAALLKIYKLASGHPYYTQLICHELFGYCQRNKIKLVTARDVDNVLGDVIERGTVNLKFIWDEADDLEKWCLAAIAHMQSRASFTSVAEILRKYQVHFTETKLRAALLHLQEKEVLTPKLSFTIALLEEWLQRNRPIDRVREELVEVNPILTRYIEIGQTFRDQNELEKALDSYAQALGVDPKNIQAMTSSGFIHLETGDPASALKEFEESLRIDPEDNNARTGFCQALVILGDEAVENKQDSSAIQSYERVFEIYPDHLEARQHLARVLDRLAGEKYSAREHAEARQLVERAAALDPDDAKIQEHKNSIVQEQDGRFLKGMLAQADRAIARNDWEQALELMEECNLRVPGHTEIQGQMEKIRRIRREQRRTTHKKRLDQLLDQRDWEKAGAIPDEYRVLEPGDEATASEWMEQVSQREEIDRIYQAAHLAVAGKDHQKALIQLQELDRKQKGYKNAGFLIRWTRFRLWFGRVYARYIRKAIPAVSFVVLGLIAGLVVIPALRHKPPVITIPRLASANIIPARETDAHPALDVITPENYDRLEVIGESGSMDATRAIVSPGGNYLVLVRPKSVDLFTQEMGTWVRPVWVRSIPAPDVTQVFLYAEDSRMITLDSRGEISTWDTATAEMIKTFATTQDYPFTGVITPDGSRLAIPNQAAQKIDVWDLAAGEKIAGLNAGISQDPGIAISNDGTTLAITNKNYTALVWDLQRPEKDPLVLVVGEAPPDAINFSTVGRTPSSILAVAFQPGSRTIAIVTEQAIYMWDLSTDSLLGETGLEASPSKFAAIAFSANGEIINLIHGVTFYRLHSSTLTQFQLWNDSGHLFGSLAPADIKIEYASFGNNTNEFILKQVGYSPSIRLLQTYDSGAVYAQYGGGIDDNFSYCEELSFSPDSTHLAVRCNRALSIYSDASLVAQKLGAPFSDSEWIDDKRLGIVQDYDLHIYYPFGNIDELLFKDYSYRKFAVIGFTMPVQDTGAILYGKDIYTGNQISISQNGNLLTHLTTTSKYNAIHSVRGSSFLVAEMANTLEVIRIDDNNLIKHRQCSIPSGTSYAFSQEQRIAVFSQGGVSKYDFNCFQSGQSIYPYPATQANAFTPQGDLFGIGYEYDQWVFLFANFEKSLVERMPVNLNYEAGEVPASMAISPDGKQMAILSNTGHLWLLGVPK